MFLDEVVFTKQALQTMDWSLKNTNLCVDEVDYYTPYKCVIAAISMERGLEFSQLHPCAIDAVTFQGYL